MAVQIDDPYRIPEIIHNALTTAISGRPGPVVVALPEDMLVEECTVVDGKPVQAVQPHAALEQLTEVLEALAKAARPMMILGGNYLIQKPAPISQSSHQIIASQQQCRSGAKTYLTIRMISTSVI